MARSLPSALVDPGFDGLVAEALALLPAQAPGWNNHNASDPGITLLELLAYFTDALLYRAGRVGRPTQQQFLQLLTGQPAAAPDGDLSTALAAALADLSQIDCAVTTEDHERLALQALAGLPHAAGTRVRCLPNTRLGDRQDDDEGPGAAWAVGRDAGHVSVVVSTPRGCTPEEAAGLLARVRDALEPRRLLTRWLHVMAPRVVHLMLRLWVSPRPGADRQRLAAQLVQLIEAWYPEDRATADGDLALSEIADLAAGLPDVEGVDRLVLSAASRHRASLDSAAIGIQLGLHSTIGADSRLGGEAPFYGERLVRGLDGALAAVALRPWESPRLVLRAQDLHWSDDARHTPAGLPS
jgi:hypothetical protein